MNTKYLEYHRDCNSEKLKVMETIQFNLLIQLKLEYVGLEQAFCGN